MQHESFAVADFIFPDQCQTRIQLLEAEFTLEDRLVVNSGCHRWREFDVTIERILQPRSCAVKSLLNRAQAFDVYDQGGFFRRLLVDFGRSHQPHSWQLNCATGNAAMEFL